MQQTQGLKTKPQPKHSIVPSSYTRRLGVPHSGQISQFISQLLLSLRTLYPLSAGKGTKNIDTLTQKSSNIDYKSASFRNFLSATATK